MELSPGIHKIDGLNGANSFLVTAGEESAVIDTGLPGNESKIIKYLKGAGVEPSKLSYIILTHADVDHSGSASSLKGLTDAKIAIHEADAPRLSGEKKLKEVKGAMGVLFRVMGPVMRFTPVTPDLTLKDSDRLLDLLVVHTPGHTEGSISLYKENSAIFVGDAMRTDSSGWPRLPAAALSVDIELAKESIRKISALRYDLLLPGHGAPITSGASEVVAGFVQRGFS